MGHIKMHLSLYIYEILMVFLGGEVLEGGEVDQKGEREQLQ